MKNEDLLKNIEENAEKAAEAAKILEDYRSLNDGKKEILFESTYFQMQFKTTTR